MARLNAAEPSTAINFSPLKCFLVTRLSSMPESIYKKAALPVIIISVIMVIISSVRWFDHKNKVNTVILATASQKGQYYAFGKALSKVVKKHNPKINIEVIPSEGSQQNEQWLQQQKVQLALLQSNTPLSASLDVVSFLFPEVFHLVVRSDAEIKRVSDLKGKRIALMRPGSGSYSLFWVLSHHYGLQASDFTALPMSSQEAFQALETGKVDAMFQVIALGNSQMTKLLRNPKIKLVPIDQGAALQLSVPALENTKIPKGAYNGAIPIPQTDLSTVSVRAILVSHNQVDSNLIYEITRILYESRNELVKENVQAAMIAAANSNNQMGFAFHPGAQAYFDQDQPSFIVEYAEPISLGLSVVLLCVSGLLQLRVWIQGKQKIAPMFTTYN